ncbi:GntR family transcriptional regulator [Symbiobacterium terraclitae]|uniref:GntR family transcriptional regulator n=1 Tax=Symbiobacterium terraclitae TaxID=557451 RepID=A0ABS4JQR9_9FIRM|nr:GntR family transcriptional regulator [Symbiobacterium terraclitae]
MWYHIDPASGTPIYRQLVEQVRQAVASGVLRAGDRLPSVRDLAVELAVNPNTVAKAYQELEREGVIETPRGRGTFVADRDPAVPEAERLRQFAEAADRLAADAYRLRIDSEQALAIFRERLAAAERRRSGE